ncbi:MAG TPA: hypothetical protein VHZ03_36920 [Trebonia sp.]|nr:hypothetical protein [Trebonia sp.]
MTTPPREVLAAATRKAIEDHTEWDSLHCFMTLHWDGESLRPGTYAAIDPGIDPPDYPALMAKIAREELEKNPGDPAYAYLLQIEGFGVIAPGPDASETEREQFDRDRLGRTFHRRPDAIESAFAYCADVHGRMWAATKTRSKPDVIEENFYPPGKHLSGQMIRGLLTVAYTTGVKAYGLPGPQNAWN